MVTMESSARRLRVVFEDHHRHNLLTQTQKSEGLKRSWILVKPELETISDLASHLTHSFDLHHSCPHGLRISMDGFVLPSFESTQVFKDKDIIRVKRKEGAPTDIIGIGDEANSLEGSDVVEKRPVVNGVKLIALEEFEKETGGYQSEPEEVEYGSPENTSPSSGRTTSKKRKSSKKIHSSKRKRIKSTSPENSLQGFENNVNLEDQSGPHEGSLSRKSLHKDTSSKTSVKLKKASTTEVGIRVEDNAEDMPTKERSDKRQENREKDTQDVPEGTKKGPSRSARRKKAKRKWLKELSYAQKKELIQSVPDKVVHNKYQEQQESEDKTDTEAEIVPIVVKPGHIRFEPLDKDQVIEQTHAPVDNFQWNGITSKRRGQKWGMEKTSVSRSNGFQDFREDPVETENFPWNGSSSKRNRQKWAVENTSTSKSVCGEYLREDSVETENFPWNGTSSKRNRQKSAVENTSTSKSVCDEDLTEASIEKLNIEEAELVRVPVNFEKLNLLSCLPKDGVVVAYRLVELSSTWCPELTEFRVGKVSWFDPASNIVMLVPVPGYPVVSDEKRDEEAATLESDNSPYMEDGSLEIDFASLVDVRIFNHDHSSPGGCKEAPASNKEVPVSSKEVVSCVKSIGTNEETHVSTTENGGSVDVWQEISQVLSEKKTQLSKEVETQKGSSDKSQRSYRAIRSSALGPTMALLRAGNGL